MQVLGAKLISYICSNASSDSGITASKNDSVRFSGHRYDNGWRKYLSNELFLWMTIQLFAILHRALKSITAKDVCLPSYIEKRFVLLIELLIIWRDLWIGLVALYHGTFYSSVWTFTSQVRLDPWQGRSCRSYQFSLFMHESSSWQAPEI